MSDEVVFSELVDALLTPDAPQEKRTLTRRNDDSPKDDNSPRGGGDGGRGRGRRRGRRQGSDNGRDDARKKGNKSKPRDGKPAEQGEKEGASGDGKQRQRRRRRSRGQKPPKPKTD